MSELRTRIYHHLDKNGFQGQFYVSMGVSVDVEEQNIKTIFPKTFRISSNSFGLTDKEYEKIIIDYIYETTNIQINSLVNLENYSSVEGLPFIIEIFKSGENRSSFSLAFGTIDGTLALTDTDNIVSLGNIETINGDLCFRGSKIKSLGNLKFIRGSFYINQFDTPFTYLTSVGKLEEVGGNLILKNSPVVHLGSLKRVGGTLNLRKTNIMCLSELEYVGGDLFLPKSKKETINVSKVTVGGNLKYFNN